MTLRDYIEKHYPAFFGPEFSGGVRGCPDWFDETKHMQPKESDWWCHGPGPDDCDYCWGRESKDGGNQI